MVFVDQVYHALLSRMGAMSTRETVGSGTTFYGSASNSPPGFNVSSSILVERREVGFRVAVVLADLPGPDLGKLKGERVFRLG